MEMLRFPDDSGDPEGWARERPLIYKKRIPHAMPLPCHTTDPVIRGRQVVKVGLSLCSISPVTSRPSMMR